MTAGIFAKHGVWVGPYKQGDRHNAKGYFESLPFKEAIIKKVGRIVHRGILAPQAAGWKAEAVGLIKRYGYTGGPWLVKHSAMYYPLWHEFDPRFICVRRNLKAIERSGQSSGMLTRTAAIQPHVEAMDYVRDNLGGVDVFTDEVVKGDYSSLERAFDACGLTFDPAIADDFVDPTLWHH
jgi:hypothetical protein